MKKYSENNNFFSEIDNSIKAYWLGFIYADGCIYINNNHYSLTIMIHKKDIEVLNQFLIDIESDRKILKVRERYISVVVTNKNIVLDLINLKCVPRKSNILEFPNDKIVPKKFLNDFIRGYLDGDGCISVYDKKRKNKNNLEKICEIKFIGTYHMLNGIKEYFNSSKNILQNKHSQVSYQISFAGKKYKEKVDLLYNKAHFYLKRKKEKWDEYNYYLDENNRKKCLNKLEKEKNKDINKIEKEKKLIKKDKIKKKKEKSINNGKNKNIGQYTITGEFIKWWSCTKEVAESFYTTEKAIRKVCNGERKSHRGYIWKRRVNKINFRNKKKVYQYDLNGNLIKEWESISEAAKYYNLTVQSIRRAITGKYKSSCNFVWKN